MGGCAPALEERDRAEQQLTDALLEQLDAYRLGIGAAEAQSGAGAGEAVENGARGARAARGGNDRCWNNTDAGGVPSAHHANNDTENVACVTEEEFAELLQNVASEKKGRFSVALVWKSFSICHICHGLPSPSCCIYCRCRRRVCYCEGLLQPTTCLAVGRFFSSSAVFFYNKLYLYI